MSFSISTRKEVPLAIQATETFCGQACVSMLLQYLEVVPNITAKGWKDHQEYLNGKKGKVAGSTISGQGVSEWDKYASDPLQIVNMIHAYDYEDNGLQSSLKSKTENIWLQYFSKDPNPDVNRGSFLKSLRDITGKEAEIPPAIVTIHDGAHWVVLSQYCKNKPLDIWDPNNLEIVSTLNAFVGRDPFYIESVTDKPSSFDGVESEVGTIIVADDPLCFEASYSLTLISAGDKVDNSSVRKAYSISPSAPIAHPVSPVSIESAPRVIFKKMKDYGVLSPCLFGRYVRDTQPGPAYRVKRLDIPNGLRDYYLMSLRTTSEKRAKILTRLDANTGVFLDALSTYPTKYLINKSENDPALISSVLTTIDERRGLADDVKQKWKNAVRPMLTNADANLVWRPCEESPSAFFPFYEFKENKNTLFYLRIDGRIFTKLTPVPNLTSGLP